MKAVELVKKAIAEYKMPDTDKQILVGFSGGSDSVCLLSILLELGYSVAACHLNHNMRDTAMRDMLFCEQFCKERDIPFVSKIAEKGSIKSEADARKVRYDFFDAAMRELGIEFLATAHNKNDSAETVLLNLLRGASTDGLCGISPADGRVIRPLILANKSEILEYIRERKLGYMTDETNLTEIYTRNKLRNRVIPELEREFNPKLTDSLAENARLTAYDRDYLAEIAGKSSAEVKEKSGLSCKKLCALPRAISGRVLQLLWQKTTENGQNLPHIYIEGMLRLAENAKTASRIDLPKGFTASVEYGILAVAKRCDKITFCKELEIEKFCYLEEIGIKVGIFAEGAGLKISLDGTEKLEVRSRRSGDSFNPSGMTGTKSVSDFFTDTKLAHEKRARTPILTADGKIAAVGAMRADGAFAKGVRKKDYYLIVEEI